VLVVDSSVWIDFFNGADRPAVGLLQQLLDHGEVRIVVPDLVLFEVLRGFRREQDHRLARRLFESLSIESTVAKRLPWWRPSTIVRCGPRATPCAAASMFWWLRGALKTTTRCCTVMPISTRLKRRAACGSGGIEARLP
jgi:hypothetical protein